MHLWGWLGGDFRCQHLCIKIRQQFFLVLTAPTWTDIAHNLHQLRAKQGLMLQSSSIHGLEKLGEKILFHKTISQSFNTLTILQDGFSRWTHENKYHYQQPLNHLPIQIISLNSRSGFVCQMRARFVETMAKHPHKRGVERRHYDKEWETKCCQECHPFIWRKRAKEEAAQLARSCLQLTGNFSVKGALRRQLAAPSGAYLNHLIHSLKTVFCLVFRLLLPLLFRHFLQSLFVRRTVKTVLHHRTCTNRESYLEHSVWIYQGSIFCFRTEFSVQKRFVTTITLFILL